jgi:hypothetical protein
VLISSAIFAVFVLIATWMFSRVFLFHRTEEEPARVRQEAVVFMHRLTKALRTCDEVLDPPSLDLVLKRMQTDSVVLRSVTPEGFRTMGWRLRQNEIDEFVYSNDYLSYSPPSQRVLQGPRTVVRKVHQFKLSIPDLRQPSLVRFELDLEPAWKNGRPLGETGLLRFTSQVHFRQEQ